MTTSSRHARRDPLPRALLGIVGLVAGCSTTPPAGAPPEGTTPGDDSWADASAVARAGDGTSPPSISPVDGGRTPAPLDGATDAGALPDSPAPGSASDAAADLLAYDDLGTVEGDATSFGAPDGHNDYPLAPGFGWCAGCGWSLYGETPQAGQAAVLSSDLPVYPGLRTRGFRMLHTRDNQGRMLDVAGAFSSYAVVVDGNPEIGADGTSLWMSVLLRLDQPLDPSQPVLITTHADASAWHTNEAIWSAGLYATADWSLFTGCNAGVCSGEPRSAGTARASTNKSYAVGATTLLVVRFDFKAGPDDIALFVNPIVGAAPPAADAMITTGVDLAFRDFALSANGPPVSLDEVRFGRTFGSVTPAP